MRLKSIKLAGFKSFVDPTTVPFPTNMTSIVGPNGCGKSNIIDAVRWVMGESSAKHLRGESMTDVIFNGSTQRQAIGQASIELLFDNHAASLSGEYAAFSEISIRRKVTREGVSQYYLNGSKCRRRDVTDIFLGTGMGPRSYAIIEQGMISRLIESKPEELRVYLEEAAGISKYKERRRETENRMKRTLENLERLSDIRDELGKQLSSLKRQASAAERYAEYKQSEREMSARLRALSWDKHERVRVSLVDDVRQCEQQVEDFVLEKTAGLSRIESNRTVLEEKQAEFNRLQAKFYQTGAEIAKLEQQLKFEKEKLERRAAEASRARDEELRLKERFSAQQSELAELDDTLFELQPELEMLREHELLIGDELAGQEDNFRTWLTSSELFQQQSSDARSLAERKQSAVQQSEQSINTMTDRLVRIQNERSLLEGEMQGFDFEYIASQLEHALVSLSDNAEALQLLEGRAEVDEAHYDHLESELSHHSSSLSEKKAISASLETLQKSALNASSESKGSAEQAEFEKYLDSSAASRLFDCIHVESGWGVALETVLRDYLRGYVIDQPNFSDLEVFLEQHWSIIDGGWAADEAPIKGSLAEKVQGLVGFNSLLNKVAVAESYEEAVVLTAGLGAGGSVVTREGAWLGPNWVKSSGEPSNQQGYVERAAEISALKTEIEELVEAVEGLSRTKAHAKSELASITEQRRALDLKDKQIRAAVSKLESEVSVQKVRVEQFQLRLDTNKKDSSELARLIDDEKEELVLHRDEWQEAMLNLEMIDSKRVEHSLKQSEMHEVTEAKRVALRDAQSQAHSLAMQIQQVSSRIEMLRQSLEQTSSSMESAQLRLELADSDSSESETVEEISEHLQQELASHLREEEKLSEARAGQDEVLTILREDETRREQIEAKLLESRSVLESLRMKLQAVAMEQMQDLEAIANDEFDLEVLLECAKQDGSSSQGLIAELERLATKIQRLGPINLAAIDEYSVQSERKQYLDEQDAELQEALEVLASAIRKIDKETRARFKETYEQVNAGLQALFPKIFGGGSASLELTDSDLLETGVAIIARPPGKNNSTIHLLSGGEKALTALALIFSIFKLNPAPFCMLDEVDAPLDDANVGRFANLVKEMSSTVQFIYISHNKVSMEMADQLLGVTMHEPGVSRLVSVNVEEAAQMVEA